MGVLCILCKRESSPLESRSFHKFPDNEERRNLWMKIIGVTSLNKCAKLCSDHFDEDSFHPKNDYTNTRKLLSNAIPKISKPDSLVESFISTNNISTESTDEVLNIWTVNNCDAATNIETKLNNHEHLNDNNQVFYEEFNIEHLTNEKVSPKECNLGKESSLSIKNDKNVCQKRKLKLNNEHLPRKIRFMTGCKVERLSQGDFTSEEAWKTFLNFHATQRLRLQALHNKINRKHKKIISLKGIIDKLKDKELFSAAEYLQDLPLHVQELIHRMKQRKRTLPFPAHLKNFARTLHFHSPVAYEVIRESFLKCLPPARTLNRWKCSTNFESLTSANCNLQDNTSIISTTTNLSDLERLLCVDIPSNINEESNKKSSNKKNAKKVTERKTFRVNKWLSRSNIFSEHDYCKS